MVSDIAGLRVGKVTAAAAQLTAVIFAPKVAALVRHFQLQALGEPSQRREKGDRSVFAIKAPNMEDGRVFTVGHLASMSWRVAASERRRSPLEEHVDDCRKSPKLVMVRADVWSGTMFHAWAMAAKSVAMTARCAYPPRPMDHGAPFTCWGQMGPEVRMG